LQPTATNGMNESLPLGQEKVLDFFCPFGSGLHMQVTSELKSGLFLRGLWDWLPWIELESDEQTVTDHVLIIMLHHHHHHHPLGTTLFFCISQEERLQWTSTHQ
jgi:hypothetical protein